MFAAPDIDDLNVFKHAEPGDEKKNILLITSDQQHYMTLGVNNPDIKTPHLDRLAKMGTTFNRAYTTNPTCTPARASIITGKYPSQHGAWALGTKLMEHEHCLGQDFKAAGFRTALIGKAHFQPLAGSEKFPSLESYPILQDLDYWRKFNSPFYGFEHIEICRNHTDEAHVGQHYAIWMEENGLKNWRDYFRTPTGSQPKPQYGSWHLPEKFHYNNWIAQRSNALLEDYTKTGENFFLWASFFDPHPTYLVPEPWASMYDPEDMKVEQMTEGELDDMPWHYKTTQLDDKQARDIFSCCDERGGNHVHGFKSHHRKNKAKDMTLYFGMVSMLDHYIGKILDKVDQLGLAEKTLIMFTTDHGHYYGQHGLTAKGPFNYEDGIKIPMIVSMPKSIPQNKKSDSLQSLVDFAPTALSIAGLDIPWGMSGIDQKEVWLGKKTAARDHVIVEDRFQPTKLYTKTYITDRYKLTVYQGQDYGELFDLEKDPGELTNLWDRKDFADLKNSLTTQLLHAMIAAEPIPMPRITVA